MLVPHGTFVLTLDGGRMRLSRNAGNARAIKLETIAERDFDNPRTHVLSEPQPGRSFQSSGRNRSAYESTDAHQLREDAFCTSVFDEALTATGRSNELIVIAPPHVMGVLRKHIERYPGQPVIREIVKDLAGLGPKALAERLHEHL